MTSVTLAQKTAQNCFCQNWQLQCCVSIWNICI